jgi:hypothetical protein
MYFEGKDYTVNLRVLMIDSSYNARRDIDSKVRWVENDFEQDLWNSSPACDLTIVSNVG